MRILVIGATGQIGYSLVQALTKTPHKITVLVRNRARRAFPVSVRILESPDFDAQAFHSAMHGLDHVIYTLGLPEQYVPDTALFEQTNVGLFRVFLDELVRARHPVLTYISTYEVFQAVNGFIRETHPVANPYGFSPYFQSMIRAYRLVKDYATKHRMKLVTVHPSAVYGGVNAGEGLTNYIENLLNKRFWRVPFIFDGRFPVVHASFLAEAIIAAMRRDGAFIVSDQMTTLKSIAMVLRQFTESYIPPTAPVQIARSGAIMAEWVSRVTRTKPLMARVQIDFITNGSEPLPERIIHEIGWQPTTLADGLRQYLAMRRKDGP
jgi:nucleoside-diphosphate-sugar epimerase